MRDGDDPFLRPPQPGDVAPVVLSQELMETQFSAHAELLIALLPLDVAVFDGPHLRRLCGHEPLVEGKARFLREHAGVRRGSGWVGLCDLLEACAAELGQAGRVAFGVCGGIGRVFWGLYDAGRESQYAPATPADAARDWLEHAGYRPSPTRSARGAFEIRVAGGGAALCFCEEFDVGWPGVVLTRREMARAQAAFRSQKDTRPAAGDGAAKEGPRRRSARLSRASTCNDRSP